MIKVKKKEYQVNDITIDLRMEILDGHHEEAKKKGELYKFSNKTEMINFARKGNWKK